MRGSQVSFGIRLDATETVVLGVIPRGDLVFEVYELPWDRIEKLGDRKGGQWLITEQVGEMAAKWRRITSFSERL